MAVDRSTASESVPDGPQGPVRTCVGCRERASATDLLRIVVMPGAEPGAHPLPRLAPDPRRRAPGRGAWVHPTAACVELAQRRRAFARALRAPGAIDAAPVFEYVRRAGRTTSSDTSSEQ